MKIGEIDKVMTEAWAKAKGREMRIAERSARFEETQLQRNRSHEMAQKEFTLTENFVNIQNKDTVAEDSIDMVDKDFVPPSWLPENVP